MQLLEIKQKRKREKATHRWSETQTLLLLEAVAEAIKDSPERFEVCIEKGNVKICFDDSNLFRLETYQPKILWQNNGEGARSRGNIVAMCQK